MLKFGVGNSKLSNNIATFSLPAFYTCPGAKNCIAFANRLTGKLSYGKDAEITCFSAVTESLFPKVRECRWDNYFALKQSSSMSDLIIQSLKTVKQPIVRVHVSGDFFSLDYFKAWVEAAKTYPDKTFYAYTKSVPFFNQLKDTIPNNFKITCSIGGKFDSEIKEGTKTAQVVFSRQEAKAKGLKIDKTDRLAYTGKASFALLVHGRGKAGSKQNSSIQKMKARKENPNYSWK